MTIPRSTFLTAAVVAALLGAAAVFAVCAQPASAAYGRCDPGEFCLFRDSTLRGAIYHFSGSDSNLNNDHFEVASRNEIVGNNTFSVWNLGIPDPKSDVVVYTETGYRGADACIRRGENGQLPRNWWRSIESYRWVTPSACIAAGVITLD